MQSCRSAILLKRDSNTDVFLWILRNFLEHLFWRTSANGCFCTSNHKVSHKYWASLLDQKHDMVWFLLRKFVDLVRVYSLLIIGKNNSKTFLLLDLQKNKSKVKYCNKGYLLWYQDFDRFRQVAVHYLMSILMICKETGGKIFKDTFCTEHLPRNASEICTVSFLRTFFCFFG